MSFVLRGAIFLALGTLLDPCSKLGIRADESAKDAPGHANAATPAAPVSAEQVSIDEATKLCAAGDCLTAHDRIQMALPPSAPFRQSAEFKSLENRWAEAAIAGAQTDPDLAARRKVLEEVVASNVVDPPYKTRARDTLAKLPLPSPQSGAPDASADAAPAGSGSSDAESKSKEHRHRSHEGRSSHKKGEK
ncbi:hypothetical protein [Pendulispora albinea]|uniref:Lipoprotein n=1 Tax=Pendulispora albinea TaxID=2741071 RepID=A0ABZ2M241_9BACT